MNFFFNINLCLKITKKTTSYSSTSKHTEKKTKTDMNKKRI